MVACASQACGPVTKGSLTILCPMFSPILRFLTVKNLDDAVTEDL